MAPLRTCKACGRITHPDGSCPTHGPKDRGIHSRHYRSVIRPRVLALHSHRCDACGEPARIDDPLIVHRIDRTRHDSDLEAYEVLHHSEHSTLEAHGGGSAAA